MVVNCAFARRKERYHCEVLLEVIVRLLKQTVGARTALHVMNLRQNCARYRFYKCVPAQTLVGVKEWKIKWLCTLAIRYT